MGNVGIELVSSDTDDDSNSDSDFNDKGKEKRKSSDTKGVSVVSTKDNIVDDTAKLNSERQTSVNKGIEFTKNKLQSRIHLKPSQENFQNDNLLKIVGGDAEKSLKLEQKKKRGDNKNI